MRDKIYLSKDRMMPKSAKDIRLRAGDPAHPAQYDRARKENSKMIGLEALWARKSYSRNVYESNHGLFVVVTDDHGKSLGEYPVPYDMTKYVKPGWTQKVYPREKLGIPNIDERVSLLARVVHCVTQRTSEANKHLKLIRRISLVWNQVKIHHLRKMVIKLLTCCKYSLRNLNSRNPAALLSLRPNRQPVYKLVEISCQFGNAKVNVIDKR